AFGSVARGDRPLGWRAVVLYQQRIDAFADTPAKQEEYQHRAEEAGEKPGNARDANVGGFIARMLGVVLRRLRRRRRVAGNILAHVMTLSVHVPAPAFLQGADR